MQGRHPVCLALFKTWPGVLIARCCRGVRQVTLLTYARVALLSLKAAYCGITLTAAHTVVFAELYWTPGICIQAEDRVHRIGQSNSVNVQYLVGRGTVDEILWRMLCKKVSTHCLTWRSRPQGCMSVHEGTKH